MRVEGYTGMKNDNVEISTYSDGITEIIVKDKRDRVVLRLLELEEGYIVYFDDKKVLCGTDCIKLLDNEELELLGYELCDFTDEECDECNYKYHDIFWYRTNPEAVEGTYLCRHCASKKVFFEELEGREKSLFLGDEENVE